MSLLVAKGRRYYRIQFGLGGRERSWFQGWFSHLSVLVTFLRAHKYSRTTPAFLLPVFIARRLRDVAKLNLGSSCHSAQDHGGPVFRATLNKQPLLRIKDSIFLYRLNSCGEQNRHFSRRVDRTVSSIFFYIYKYKSQDARRNAT